MRKWMTKTDALLLAVLLLLILGGVLQQSFQKRQAPQIAKVTVDGAEVLTVHLQDIKEPTVYTLENGMQLMAEQGKICVAKSSCKDLVCVHTGWLQKNGDVAACLPNKTVVSVSAQDTDTPDGLTY